MTSTLDELKATYTDSQWRDRYVKYCDLMRMLADCVISDSYVVSDELNAAVRLTSAGNKLLDRLTRKEGVNAKDARLMCGLTLGHDELFVDFDTVDISKLETAISHALESKTIRFPFVHGRELYDAYADLFEDERDVLTNDETQTP